MLPWMLRNTPVLALFYLSDILVPFVLVGSLISWIGSLWSGRRLALYGSIPLPAGTWQPLAVILGLTAVMTVLSTSIRFGRHFAHRPNDLVYLPLFMVVNTFLLMPIRVLGFFRMAHNSGWGTRSGSFAGDDRRNALAMVPYLLGGAMITAAVMVSV
jgi:hyaluronan synthase